MKFSRPAIIHNPVGGSARPEMISALVAAFAAQGITGCRLYPTGPEPQSANTNAHAAIAEGADLLIAVGGDGTVKEVASAAMFHELPMAAYQGGTGNQFANYFYPRLPAADFCKMLIEGEPQKLDVLELRLWKDSSNGDGTQQSSTQFCIVGACSGSIAEAISKAPRFWKRIFGKLVYFWRVVLACLNPKRDKIKLYFKGGETHEQELLTLAIFNVDRTPLLELAPACNASDGLVDLVCFEAKNVFQILSTCFWLLLKRPFKTPYFKHRRVEELSIRAEKPIHFNVDGEEEDAAAIDVKVLPGALRMIVSA
ncbi:MAG: hypothetical protein K2X27_04210 [Candidatus Obscuribacterales bacterium]|nr:hypothetical protein [Candidatus Obscuribacterales bacterium]